MIKNNLLRKQYTLNETNYQLKIPMELDACIPANDCVRLIRQFVEEMDLTALYATYERMPSEKYASPEIMLKIMLYAYHERKDVSSRTIEKNCKRDINYMYLLEGRKAPDHAAIARFRSKHFAKCARHFMAQMTKFLIKLEQVTTTEVFIDGTKIESAANRYTFVWRKAVTKHQARFLQKTALLVGDIIQRQELKPLWKKQVKKKHVKKILKKLRAKADEENLEMEEKILSSCVKEGMLFEFFRNLDQSILRPYQLDDKTFVEYHTSPETLVTLYYSLDTGLGTVPDYKSEPLKNVYEGIFARAFTLFYGETLRYYFQTEDETGVHKTEEKILTMNQSNDQASSKYQLINQILCARKLEKDTEVKEKLAQYLRQEQYVNEMFVIEKEPER